MTTQTLDRDYIHAARCAVNDLAEALNHLPRIQVTVMVMKLLLQIDYAEMLEDDDDIEAEVD